MHIEISREFRSEFKLWQHSTTVPAAHASRVKAIMYVAEGFTITETSKKVGLSRRTIYKWLNRYISGAPSWYVDRSRRPHRSPKRLPVQIKRKVISMAATLVSLGQNPSGAEIQAKLQKTGNHIPGLSTINKILGDARSKGTLSIATLPIEVSEEEELTLKRIARRITPSSIEARRAMAVILHSEGVQVMNIAAKINTSTNVVKRWISRFECDRASGVYVRRANRYKKAEDEDIKEKVFKFLHSPPLSHGINRTSWRLTDLKTCLAQNGLIVSSGVISQIIKSEGYRWRKARKVLTSPDPDYREKLNQIKQVLRNLQYNERFFSIDEFGPCAIRKREGRRIVGPEEEHWIPQYQRSKGSLIITAALELSTNQVTHFYSTGKNTTEMIKLIYMLLLKYKDMKTLYLSWDAASWHNSAGLWSSIKEANEHASTETSPYVKVVPLPISAQFLNVIESIFSGLAKAVIHNSDYDSVEEAKQAIDRHFCERNEYYLKHPKRAGNKIWGEELVIPKFSESHNCKNPQW